MIESNSQSVDLISLGKALALSIKGLLSIGHVSDGFGIIEGKIRSQLINLYRRELRRTLAKVSEADANEILAVIGPKEGTITVDPSLN